LPVLLETPPRAWGKLDDGIASRVDVRNTPTGVGKTAMAAMRLAAIEKHPHGRGENCPMLPWAS